MEKEIGEITHWYDKIGVAVIKLTSPLAKGDTVKVVRGDDEFEETVNELQIDHAPVEKGKKGDELAVKLSNKAKVGATVYKA
jgi:hypothetical protein